MAFEEISVVLNLGEAFSLDNKYLFLTNYLWQHPTWLDVN